MELHTFKEWAAAGYRIRKGAKSKVRNSEGVPLFNPSQVRIPITYYTGPRRSSRSERLGMSREEDYDMAVAYLGDRDWF